MEASEQQAVTDLELADLELGVLEMVAELRTIAVSLRSIDSSLRSIDAKTKLPRRPHPAESAGAGVYPVDRDRGADEGEVTTWRAVDDPERKAVRLAERRRLESLHRVTRALDHEAEEVEAERDYLAEQAEIEAERRYQGALEVERGARVESKTSSEPVEWAILETIESCLAGPWENGVQIHGDAEDLAERIAARLNQTPEATR